MKMDTRKIIREYVEEKEVQDEIFALPYEARKEIQTTLEDALMNPSEEEQELGEISYGGIPEYKADGKLAQMFKWVKRYLTDKASNFLINSSAAEMADTIDMLKVLDPYDMNGIFKPRAMYLGGGIDFAADSGLYSRIIKTNPSIKYKLDYSKIIDIDYKKFCGPHQDGHPTAECCTYIADKLNNEFKL